MDYAIYTENLTKKFGEFIAVNNVSLKIKQGSIYGLLGSNVLEKYNNTYVMWHIKAYIRKNISMAK